jgi:predicted RNase H-like HicB family nuclease
MGERVIRILVHMSRGERGWIVAESPEVPGAVSQGRTEDEALQNIHEAVEGVLETRLGFVLSEERDASGRLVQLFEAHGHPRALPVGAWERLIEIDIDAIARRLRGTSSKGV